MFIVFGSVKGSPGVSCLTAGVAACLRRDGADAGARGGRRPAVRPLVLIVEADPSGGVFAGRAGLAAHPGMASMAARTRGAGLSTEAVAAHVQVLPSGVGVLVGPLSGEQASSGLEVLADGLVRFGRSRPDGELLLVDVGRMDLDSAATPLVWSADGVVLVVRADREGLEQAAGWLRAAPELAGRVAVVLREPNSAAEYSPREVSDGLGVQVLGRLPVDEDAAKAFTVVPRRAGPRGGWWRAVGQITEQVARLAPLVAGDPAVLSARGMRGEWGAGRA